MDMRFIRAIKSVSGSAVSRVRSIWIGQNKVRVYVCGVAENQCRIVGWSYVFLALVHMCRVKVTISRRACLLFSGRAWWKKAQRDAPRYKANSAEKGPQHLQPHHSLCRKVPGQLSETLGEM